MSIINAGALRLNETGTHTLTTCQECGKGLDQDDAFGHDCEVGV